MMIIIPVVLLVILVVVLFQPWKGMTKSRIYATLFAGIPPVVIAFAAIIFQVIDYTAGRIEVSGASNILFIIVTGWIAAAIIISIVFAFLRRTELLKGTVFGTGITILFAIVTLGLLEWMGGV
jgi:hypothetical protein